MIQLDNTTLKELVLKARDNVYAYSQAEKSDLTKMNDQLLTDYNNKSFIKKWFSSKPEISIFYYHFSNDPFDFAKDLFVLTKTISSIKKLCNILLNALEESNVVINLTSEEYNKLKYWANKK